MASTYSDNFKLQLMATGENAGTWGTVTNVNLGTAIEEALGGTVDVTFSSGTVTLTASDDNTTQQYRHMRLNLTGTSGGAQDLVVPAVEKVYIVNNGCSDAITIKVSGQTGVAVPAGKTMFVYNNGTDCVDAVTHLSSLTLASALPVASGGTGSTTAAFSGENISALNASNVSSGTLSNARTTASSSNGASTIVARDASGDFAGSTITATTGFSGPGGSLTSLDASNISSGTLANARTNASSANGASTLVVRDASGDFAGNIITATEISTASGNLVTSPATNILEVEGDGVSVVGQLQLNCHVNSHGQKIASQPHSEAATNTLTLPGGTTIGNSDATLVSDSGTQTLTNKTLTSPTITGTGSIAGTFTGNVTGNLTGNADTATALATGRTISLTGDVTGTSGSFDGTGNVSISATIAANSVALGTDTTGNYVATITNGTGISGSSSTEGGTPTIALSHLGLENLTDPNADRVFFWDDSAGASAFLTMGTNLSISGTTLNATDTDTTYSAGSGLDLSGTTFSVEADLRDGITHVGLDTGDYISWTNNSYTSFYVNGNEEARLESDGDWHADGDVIAYSTTISDRRLKDEITNISEALDKVGKINGVTFVRKNNGQKSAGVVAQEIMEVLPEAVKEKALPLQTGSEDDLYYVVEYDAVTGLLVEAVKELKARVEALEAK